MSRANEVFSGFSIVSFFLVVIPLPWHLEAWNMGTVLYIGWTSLSLLIFFINSVVWNGSIENVAPVWCDIATKLQVGATIGIPTASLCITRRLFYISRASTLSMDRKDKIKQVVTDASIGILIPIVFMALHYVVQGHRFDIFEDIGCLPATFNVTLQYVLVQAPTILIPLVSCVFAGLAIRNLVKRDISYRTMLSGSSLASSLEKSSGSQTSMHSLTSSRYTRLMLLASMEIVIGLPIAITVCILNATTSRVYPWVSWEDTHTDFARVDQFTAAEWRSSNSTALLEMNRWLSVVCGLLFFVFFGFAQEARKNYGKVWAVVRKYGPGVGKVFETYSGKRESFGNFKLGSSGGTFNGSSSFAKFKVSSRGTNGNASKTALPIYVEKEVVKKRDSFDTFTSADLLSLHSRPGDTTVKLSSIVDTTSPSTPSSSSAPHSRSSSPRPRVGLNSDVSSESEYSEIHSTLTDLRTPESAFPRPVTPDALESQTPPTNDSFLEIMTPATNGFSPLKAPTPAVRRGDNWI